MWGLRALRASASVLSPKGARARLTVLIFHRVLPEADPLRPEEPCAATFRWQMEVVARLFNVLPLSEAVFRLNEGTLPSRAATITFDDGYADNHTLALPVLNAFGFPATFFIATGFLNGGRMFNDTVIEAIRTIPDGPVDLRSLDLGIPEVSGAADRLALIPAVLSRVKYAQPGEREALLRGVTAQCADKLPNGLMMTGDQVRALVRAGMEVGAHTVDHPVLTRIALTEARREILDSRRDLEALTNREVRLFAYPNGQREHDYNASHSELLHELGFDGAVTTNPGVAAHGANPHALPRFTPWDRTPARFGARLIRNLMSTEPPRVEEGA